MGIINLAKRVFGKPSGVGRIVLLYFRRVLPGELPPPWTLYKGWKPMLHNGWLHNWTPLQQSAQRLRLVSAGHSGDGFPGSGLGSAAPSFLRSTVYPGACSLLAVDIESGSLPPTFCYANIEPKACPGGAKGFSPAF